MNKNNTFYVYSYEKEFIIKNSVKTVFKLSANGDTFLSKSVSKEPSPLYFIYEDEKKLYVIPLFADQYNYIHIYSPKYYNFTDVILTFVYRYFGKGIIMNYINFYNFKAENELDYFQKVLGVFYKSRKYIFVQQFADTFANEKYKMSSKRLEKLRKNYACIKNI